MSVSELLALAWYLVILGVGLLARHRLKAWWLALVAGLRAALKAVGMYSEPTPPELPDRYRVADDLNRSLLEVVQAAEKDADPQNSLFPTDSQRRREESYTGSPSQVESQPTAAPCHWVARGIGDEITVIRTMRCGHSTEEIEICASGE